MISMANLNIPRRNPSATRSPPPCTSSCRFRRMRDGFRRITHVTEIIGMEGDTITLNDLFIYTR